MHLDYCDRFTFINYRNVERSKVIFIKYTNSPPYIQRFIDRTLKLHRKYCCTFIDDIIIFSNIFKDHSKYLRTVFSLFEEKSININPEKLFISYLSIELFNFYIDAFNIHSTEDRIQNFCQLKFLTILKVLKTYLRATNFLYFLILYYI